MKKIQNYTSAISYSSDFIGKCSTSMEDSLATYAARYKGLEDPTDFILAFLMNLTGNVLTLFNVFTSLSTATEECDYATAAQRVGTLFK